MTNGHEKSAGTVRLVIGLAFALGLVNYLDRVVISYAIGPIQRDFGIDNAGFGLAMSFFAAGALAVNGISGVLLDRYGARRIWTLGLIVWSMTMFLMGWVHYWWLFLAFRVVLGIGEGVNFPAMNRAIADWVPRGETTRATSFALLGVPVALLIGGPLFSLLIERFGWRETFMALGLAGFALMVTWLLLYREPPKTQTPATPTLAEYAAVLRNPTLLATAWSFFGFGAILFFGVTWIPGYFEHEFDLKLTAIGWFTTMPWAFSIVGMALMGTLSDRLFSASGDIRRARIHPTWILQLLAAAAFIPLASVTSSDWAIVWLTLGNRLLNVSKRPLLLNLHRLVSEIRRCGNWNYCDFLLGLWGSDAIPNRMAHGCYRVIRYRFPHAVRDRRVRGARASAFCATQKLQRCRPQYPYNLDNID